jgi:hypothetical protein
VLVSCCCCLAHADLRWTSGNIKSAAIGYDSGWSDQIGKSKGECADPSTIIMTT